MHHSITSACLLAILDPFIAHDERKSPGFVWPKIKIGEFFLLFQIFIKGFGKRHLPELK
jgi:hypothetical protein